MTRSPSRLLATKDIEVVPHSRPNASLAWWDGLGFFVMYRQLEMTPMLGVR
ncbi:MULTISPECIES: hypothetical protein [Paenibacillus]|uniref:hypothetical protein n=1 Tax=Paenibacillus TaxID=44249 RepID=UPI0013595EEF|nr:MULTISPECIES: hypothetical protein [Paenibacillus]